MTLRILDLAEADLLRGFRIYERKSRMGDGDEGQCLISEGQPFAYHPELG